MNKREIKKSIQRRIKSREDLMNTPNFKKLYPLSYYEYLAVIRELKDLLKEVDF